jgi:predicted phage tail protein
MDNQILESFNNLISFNNQTILSDISNKLETIVSDLSNGRQISSIIKQINNIILIINKIYNDNQKNIDTIRNDIKNLNDNISNNFKILLSKSFFNNESEGFITRTATYSGGDK